MTKVDKGRAWVIAASTFWTMLTVLAIQRSSGVLFKSMMSVYNVSREAAAWPFYLRKTIGFLTANLIGIVNAYFSMKLQICVGITLCSIGMSMLFFVNDILSITLIFGILYGIGSGIIMMCNLIVVNKFFSRYRTVALGITLAGNSLGAFILPPLIEYFIHIYKLRGSYLLLTGIVLQSFLVVPLYEDSPHQTKPTKTNGINILELTEKNSKKELPTNENSHSTTLLKSILFIIKCPMYHVIWITYAIFDFVFQTFITIIIDHSTDCDIKKHKAVYLLSVLSIAELIGRLGSGWFVDLQLIKRKNMMRISFFSFTVIYLMIPFLHTYIALIFISAFIGLVGSFVAINGSALFTDYLGLKNLPLGMGFSSTFIGLTGLVTPTIIGYIRDTTGSYDLLFYIFASVCLLVTVLWMAEPSFILLQSKINRNPVALANAI